MRKINHKYQYVHDPILVSTFSDKGRFTINTFIWKNHKHKVKEQCLASKARKGETPVWLFSVLTEDGSYKLRLDTDTLSWWLEEVYTDINP